LRENDLIGRIQIHGLDDSGNTIEAFRLLVQRLPGLEIVPPGAQSPLAKARATKGPDEVERIQRMGAITIEIVDRVADFLSSQRVRQGTLVDRRGEAVTVGDVRRRIHLWLAERGAESPEGIIFAVGRDAGVPHNSGTDDQPIPIGVPIVLDLFPCEGGGGYFYDFTRTWCIGHAADEVAQFHHDVSQAYDLALAQARPGANARAIQLAVCEYFEKQGHSSVLTSPNTRDGYVHSIGHGLGLEVHEPPFFRLQLQPPASLEAGQVLTIEPGLYYPERGVGVRLEDTVCIGRDGPQVLAAYPMDFILPMRRSPRGQASKASRTKKTPARQANRVG
jgi:Xaa-Pro aminopeptidase